MPSPTNIYFNICMLLLYIYIVNSKYIYSKHIYSKYIYIVNSKKVWLLLLENGIRSECKVYSFVLESPISKPIQLVEQRNIIIHINSCIHTSLHLDYFQFFCDYE